MALITATEARLYVPDLTGTGEDTNLNTLITRAGAMLAAHCGYPAVSATTSPTLESATYTWYLDSPGGEVLELLPPLTGVTTLHDDPERLYGSDALLASTDYERDEVRGLVVLKTDGNWGRFSRRGTYRAIKAVFTAGWTTIPEPVKQACAELARHLWHLRRRMGSQSASGKGSASFREETIPDAVLELIAPYRSVRGWLS